MCETGAYERYFRREGGKVKALPLIVNLGKVDKNVGKMRLYCLRLSDRILVLGGGAVTTCQKYQDDPNVMSIIQQLRTIDKQIRYIVRDADYEDLEALSKILETISV